jgi:uncharacterized membrane protein YphA (DoxX/SURF4 family)
MNARKIGYWAATGLAALAFAMGGAMDLAGAKDVVEGLAHLGYPAYFATLIGAWKVLGAIAIVVPRFARLKEWAYAGMIFDLTGASFSHAMSHDPPDAVITPLVITALVVASWALRPASRVLGELGVAKAPESSPGGDVVGARAAA